MTNEEKLRFIKYFFGARIAIIDGEVCVNGELGTFPNPVPAAFTIDRRFTVGLDEESGLLVLDASTYDPGNRDEPPSVDVCFVGSFSQPHELCRKVEEVRFNEGLEVAFEKTSYSVLGLSD